MPFHRRVSAVVCSTDLDRSKAFYETVVGLRLSPDTIKNHLVFECGDGTTLLVYGRGAPNLADHTQVRFWTDDVEADVRELAQRGVVFDELDLGAIKTRQRCRDRPGHRKVGVVQGSRWQHRGALRTRARRRLIRRRSGHAGVRSRSRGVMPGGPRAAMRSECPASARRGRRAPPGWATGSSVGWYRRPRNRRR